ncbi:putative gp65 [Burkholderia pseudomallei TSV28]|nr:putative gp65 [Burkholderia pseudomallei TSV28]
MSAYLYFDQGEIAEPVAKMAVRRNEASTGRRVIAFPGCPLEGVELKGGQIEMRFPRSEEIRTVLINWLMYWGIPFRVIP